MSSNYFEQLPQALEQQEQELAAHQREREIEQHNFELMQQQRVEEHAGDSPLKVWGSESQKLVDEFLEFAGNTAVNGTFFFGAEQLKSSYDDWETRGYRLNAYIHPAKYVGKKETSSSSPPEPKSPEGIGTIPNPDIWLCIDGLIRKNDAVPLNLLSKFGNVETPEFGEWKIHHFHIDRSTTDGSGWPIRHYPDYYHSITRSFERLNVEDGLRADLTKYAWAIHNNNK